MNLREFKQLIDDIGKLMPDFKVRSEYLQNHFIKLGISIENGYKQANYYYNEIKKAKNGEPSIFKGHCVNENDWFYVNNGDIGIPISFKFKYEVFENLGKLFEYTDQKQIESPDKNGQPNDENFKEIFENIGFKIQTISLNGESYLNKGITNYFESQYDELIDCINENIDNIIDVKQKKVFIRELIDYLQNDIYVFRQWTKTVHNNSITFSNETDKMPTLITLLNDKLIELKNRINQNTLQKTEQIRKPKNTKSYLICTNKKIIKKLHSLLINDFIDNIDIKIFENHLQGKIQNQFINWIEKQYPLIYLFDNLYKYFDSELYTAKNEIKISQLAKHFYWNNEPINENNWYVVKSQNKDTATQATKKIDLIIKELKNL